MMNLFDGDTAIVSSFGVVVVVVFVDAQVKPERLLAFERN